MGWFRRRQRLVVARKSLPWLSFFAIGWFSVVGLGAPLSASASGFELPEDFAPEHAKLLTSDPTPVEPGSLEFELGLEFLRGDRAFDSRGNTEGRARWHEQSGGFALTVGVVPDLDVAIGSSYASAHDTDGGGPLHGNGFGDLEASVRYRFHHDTARRLEIASILEATIPTGSSGGGLGPTQHYASMGARLVASHDFAKRWTLSSDLGFIVPIGEKRGEERGAIEANLAGGVHLTTWLQPILELNYAHGFGAGVGPARQLSVTAGLLFPLENLRISLGVSQVVLGRSVERRTLATCLLTIRY